MKLLETFNRKVDEEYSQAIARIIIVGMVLITLFFKSTIEGKNSFIVAIAMSYFIFSLLWAAFVKKFPGHYIARRLTCICGDLGMTSIVVYFSTSNGVAFYPLYLWIILGNGMRFGEKYLLTAIGIGVVTFGTVIAVADYWSNNLPTGLGLMLGIIILPLFYLVLIRRLHLANKQQAKELKKSQHHATHDAMTGLANRAYFFHRLEDEIKRALRYSGKFTVLYIDLDDFKKINDNFGHKSGDWILNMVADLLRSTIRESDFAARLGGDEFALLLPTLIKTKDIEAFSSKLISKISESTNIDGAKLSISASIGASVFPFNGDSVNEIIDKADQAMYHSKKGGKNHFTLYHSDIAVRI